MDYQENLCRQIHKYNPFFQICRVILILYYQNLYDICRLQMLQPQNIIYILLTRNNTQYNTMDNAMEIQQNTCKI
jgi:hypothetical protein